MTSITSSVTRRTVEDREGGTTRKGRRIVVTLGPANMVKVREERTQNEYTVMADELYSMLEYNAAKALLSTGAAPRRRVKRSVL